MMVKKLSNSQPIASFISRTILYINTLKKKKKRPRGFWAIPWEYITRDGSHTHQVRGAGETETRNEAFFARDAQVLTVRLYYLPSASTDLP